MNKELMFSSERTDWATPRSLMELVEKRWGKRDLDVCAEPGNAVCPRFLSPKLDALSPKTPWSGLCWMNPPYGREIGRWVREARDRAQGKHRDAEDCGDCDLCLKAGPVEEVLCLLPARTDTSWWHDVVMQDASEVCLIRGRITFEGAKASAPFPSCLVLFRRKRRGTVTQFTTMAINGRKKS